MIGAALRRAIGREPYLLSGDLESDIRRGGPQARAILSEPTFIAVLPELIRAVLAIGPDQPITYDRIAPNRQRIADEYARLAAADGFRADIDPALAADLVIGGHLSRLLATGRVPSKELSEQMLDVIIAGLRSRP